MKIFAKYTLMILTIIGIISFQGCEDDGELPTVIAGFTFTANEDTGTVTFINISENASTYLWDFGDGETSKEIDPIKTYAAGTFIVTLTANNVSGVSDVFKDTITVNIKGIISLPATFDDPNINYKANAFDGASFDIVDNPDLAGTNNKTTKVGAITNSGAVFEGVFFELGTAVDFAVNKRITMNFWSEDIIDVLLKFEGTSPSIEKSTTHGGTGWESISFDFTSSNKFGKLVLFVDGPGTKAGTFFIDDIKQEATPIVPVTCTAETVQSLSAADFNLTHQADPSANIISDNAGFAWVDNPDSDDSVNPSCKAGQITRTTANAFVNNQIDLDAKLDFNANAGFKVKVRSAVTGFTLTVKLEDKTNSSINTELTVAATKTNEWEELTFPFASTENNKYDKIILFFDLGKTNSSVYYLDDLKLFAGTGGGGGCTETVLALPIDFDCESTNYDFVTFNGASYQVVDNPQPSGINPTVSKVGEIVNIGGPFEGGAFTLGTPVDFSTDKAITMKLYSTMAVPILLKFEGAVPPIETSVNHGGTGWEQLTFNFTSSDQFTTLVLFIDGPGSTAGTFFVDDIEQVPVVGGGGCTETVLALPIDFDCESTTYNFATFNGASYQVVDNPQPSGINPTVTKVGEIINIGGPFEGGAFTLGTPVDFSTDKAITMKLYSTVAVPILLKFEGAVPPIETSVNHGGTGWEQLTFNFTSSDQFTVLVLFVDGPGTTAGTFYIDDIEQIPAAGGGSGSELTINGDFETGDATGWFLFQNGGTAALDNTQQNGGAWSGRLATGGPSNPAFKQERIGAGTVAAGDVVSIQFDHIGAVVQPGAVFNVLLFGEGSSGASFTHVFNPAPILGAGWTTFSGQFAIAPGTDVSEGISFLIEAVCGGDAGCSVTANIDNVSVTLNP